MKQDILSYHKSIMPCVDFKLAEAKQDDKQKDDKSTKQSLSIKGGVDDPKKPSFVKIILDLSIYTKDESIKLHITQESIYDVKKSESSVTEIAEEMKNEAVPESYRRLSSFVRYLTNKVGVASLKLPSYSELTSEKNSRK